MCKIARRVRRTGLISLLLAILLLLVLCAFPGQVYAQNVQSIYSSRHPHSVHYAVRYRRFLGRAAGKVIVISLARQRLYAYEDGSEVFSTPVMTGRPSLPTPAGTYHIFAKESPATFVSPFSRGSANWYPPTHINYALEFLPGFFLHDSWWHSVYGPGTNGWHHDPVDGWQLGSHGCVAMSLGAAAWLYSWAPVGTTVQIEG